MFNKEVQVRKQLRRYFTSLLSQCLASFNVMVVECAWCKKFRGFKKGVGGGVTSGICKKCLANELKILSHERE